MIVFKVNDQNCTARIEGFSFGNTLEVQGYDASGSPSGYVYLDGKQICNGFAWQGVTMLYSPRDWTFTEFIRDQTRRLKKNNPFLEIQYRVIKVR